MTTAVAVHNLQKTFAHSKVFDNLSLDIEQGAITAIFGPNASGKSTLLNILSGIVSADGGSYKIENFNHFQFSYIFQNYRESLLPWRTNFENVALPLQIQGKSDKEISARLERLQELFEFKVQWDHYPYELSGGQQQIVAFMRALITEPRVLFIDEPFSALDYENNLKLREHLQKYYLAFKPTIVLVTHNIEEAVHLAQKILVLSKKPTTVLETIQNPLPYPRTLASLRTEDFHKTKDKVLAAFERAANL
jgi:NitT/TauT family transport system ATP-binding protein